MSTIALPKIIPNTNRASTLVAGNQLSSRTRVSFAPRPIKASISNDAAKASENANAAIKEGVDGAFKTGKDVQEQIVSSAGDVDKKLKSDASNAADATEDFKKQATQGAEDAWKNVKDNAEKIGDAVTEKSEEAKKAYKENADKL